VLSLPGVGRKELSKLSDSLREKMPDGILILANETGEALLVSTPKANKDLNAHLILKNLVEKLGGKGGGRPDFAQGSIMQTKDLLKVSLEILSQL
jgi:alanyl-tRNA synthetase